MFGYVLPVKCEMKVGEFETYRSLYCGVCKQLQKSYGVLSRFLLNYDLVLLSVVADALSGEAGETCIEGCFANPLAKRPTKHATQGLTLGADGLVMLSYHKLRDNIDDEKFFKRLGYRLLQPFARHLYRRAQKRRPQLAEVFTAQMARQRQLEAAQSASLDEACEPTAKMCEALFQAAAIDEAERQTLGRLGLFAGQIVYLLDATEDYDEDARKGRYNVFLQAGLSREEAIEAARRRCRMAAGEIALCYNLLNLRQYKPILDNIFFLGLPAGIAGAGVKRSKRRTGHGQIESV